MILQQHRTRLDENAASSSSSVTGLGRSLGTLACALLFMLLLQGCGSTSWSGRAEGKVEQLHLLGTPVAIDVDKKPGSDGLGVRVYASNRTAGEAVRIGSGKLELLLFDGALAGRELARATPIVSLAYTAEQLRKLEHKTAVGTSYNFVPVWTDQTAPTKGRVTVIALYTGTDGRQVRSSAITVPLGSR